jgi:hypothetical protein
MRHAYVSGSLLLVAHFVRIAPISSITLLLATEINDVDSIDRDIDKHTRARPSEPIGCDAATRGSRWHVGGLARSSAPLTLARHRSVRLRLPINLFPKPSVAFLHFRAE